MDSTEIVIGMVDRNHMAMVFELLREGIGEPRETTDAHPQVQVLPFHVTSRDVLPIRIAAQNARSNADALGRTVATIRTICGCAVQLYQHRVIHVHSESTFDSFRICAKTVGRDLNARGNTRC